MTPPLSITRQGIARAARLIAPEFLDTPMHEGVTLEGTDAPAMLLKDETATPIGCFKGRGTDYYAQAIAGDAPVVVCASAGNFGQGLARAMARRGGRAVVFAATNANPLKLRRMRELGGEVVLEGGDFDAANEAARAHAAREGLPFVEDAAFGEIAEGAGTLAREMTEGGAAFDAFYVPVGGGALANGIGTWLRHARPEAKVIGVCARGAPSLALSWERGEAVGTDAVDTFADGIAIRAPVPAAVRHMREVVDAFVLVDDEEILRAMRAVDRALGIRLEPSGAAGVAAILKDARARGLSRPATVLCGANVPEERIADWFEAR